VPTLDAEGVCAQFDLVSAPAQHSRIDYDGTVIFAWKKVPVNTTLTLQMILRGSKAGLRVDVPVSDDILLPFPMKSLPQEGIYDWQLWLNHPDYGHICQHNGLFTRLSQPF